MHTLRWRDHFVHGEFDDEAGRAHLRRLYLGDGGIIDTFIEAFASTRFASEWREHLIYDRETRETTRQPIASAADARKEASVTEPFELASPSQNLYALYDYAQRFAVKVTASPVSLENALDLIRRVAERAPAELVRSPILAFTKRPVPRIRPRRMLAHWPSDATLMLVDRKQLEQCVADKVPGEQPYASADELRYTPNFLAELETLCSSRLPEGASLSTRDGQLVFDFSSASASAFERWICGLGLRAHRHIEDNEHGDPAVDGSSWAGAASEDSGVTLYECSFTYTAYCADIQDGSSIANPEKLETLARAKRDGKLVTGERVKRVMLIVPVREEAVALSHLVTQGIVDGVVYKSGEYLYDPNALGESYFVPFPS